MLRILLLVKRFNFGGAENHVCDLANSFAGNGHEVWIMSEMGKQHSKLDPAVHFIPVRFLDILFPFHCLHVASFVKKHRIQIVHAHQRLAISVAGQVSKLTGVPAIATVHGRTQYDLRRRSTRKKIQAVIFVSRYVHLHSARYPELAGKTFYIPNGIPSSPGFQQAARNRIYYASRIDKHHYGVISMLIHDVIPELVKKIPEISLGIIGDGKKMKTLKKEATRLNATGQKGLIVILGYHQNVANNFNDAALVLGVGRVGLESLYHGVPLLSLNRLHLGSVVSLANLMEMSENNFVAIGADPPTPEKLLQLLFEFFRNRSIHENETLKIQTYLQQNLGMDQVTKSILELYQKLLDTQLRKK